MYLFSDYQIHFINNLQVNTRIKFSPGFVTTITYINVSKGILTLELQSCYFLVHGCLFPPRIQSKMEQ